MGAILSVFESPKVKTAKSRLNRLVKDAWWLGSAVVWTVATAAVVLAIPVFFEYERECQMFEQMQQMQAAQMHAAEAASSAAL